MTLSHLPPDARAVKDYSKRKPFLRFVFDTLTLPEKFMRFSPQQVDLHGSDVDASFEVDQQGRKLDPDFVLMSDHSALVFLTGNHMVDGRGGIAENVGHPAPGLCVRRFDLSIHSKPKLVERKGLILRLRLAKVSKQPCVSSQQKLFLKLQDGAVALLSKLRPLQDDLANVDDRLYVISVPTHGGVFPSRALQAIAKRLSEKTILVWNLSNAAVEAFKGYTVDVPWPSFGAGCVFCARICGTINKWLGFAESNVAVLLCADTVNKKEDEKSAFVSLQFFCCLTSKTGQERLAIVSSCFLAMKSKFENCESYSSTFKNLFRYCTDRGLDTSSFTKSPALQRYNIESFRNIEVCLQTLIFS